MLFFNLNTRVFWQLGDFSLGREPVGGSASLGKCKLGGSKLCQKLKNSLHQKDIDSAHDFQLVKPL